MRSVLTIAGSDSSGGAGIQADLRAFAALGVHGATAITAVTAQNASGMWAMHPLEADLVAAQIEAVAAGLPLHATKIGMLGTAAIAEAVAAAIEDLQLPLVVLDPVLASTSGARLIDDEGVQTLLTELLPRVFVVTPNLPEAEALSGVRIGSPAAAREAARRLHGMGAGNVIVKGGHLREGSGLRAEGSGERVEGSGLRDEGSGLRDEGLGLRDEGLGLRDEGLGLRDKRLGLRDKGAEVVDLLYDGRTFHELRVARVETAGMRGTGCSYASAVAAWLALGHSLPDAAARAQRFVAGLIGRTYTG